MDEYRKRRKLDAMMKEEEMDADNWHYRFNQVAPSISTTRSKDRMKKS